MADIDARLLASVKVAGTQARPRFDELLGRLLCGSVALAGLASCDSVIGLRDDYYLVVGGSSGEPSAGAGAAAGTSVAGGSPSEGGSGNAGGGGEVNGGGGTSGGGDDAGVGEGGQGDAGSGGAPDSPSCEDFPITASKTWGMTSFPSDSRYPTSALIDKMAARWSVGRPQAGTEWLQFDFRERVALRRLNFQQGTMNANDYPRKYEVIVSDIDQNTNGLVALTGAGMYGPTTNIVLPRVMVGRYVLVKQRGSSVSWWSSEEIEIDCY